MMSAASLGDTVRAAIACFRAVDRSAAGVYVFVEEPDRIVAAATAFSADGDRFDKPDFQAKFVIKAINPLDRMNWRGDELTLEVVPMNTRLDEVEAMISGYLEAEPAL